ncbi:hypothetical protein SESBI_27051 [Sesbania bispinosa]|nr:hypothetical protein SESBI_27051 [Sesbania bispinosa]
MCLPRASLPRIISKESASQRAPPNAPSQPCDVLHSPRPRSGALDPREESTIRVTPFCHSKGASQPLDPTKLTHVQSQPFDGSTIRVMEDNILNLEDKAGKEDGSPTEQRLKDKLARRLECQPTRRLEVEPARRLEGQPTKKAKRRASQEVERMVG